MSVTGIVLAGGRGRRFGGAKLAAEFQGSTLLQRAVDAVAGIADEVLIAGGELPAGTGSRQFARLVPDLEPFAGPLVALSGALDQSDGNAALIVGGDMPGLVPAVLKTMLERLDRDPSVDAVILAAPTNAASEAPHPRQVLPLALRVDRARSAARASLASGHRSLQRLLDELACIELPASDWLALDPEALTLLDVDTEADLDRIRARNPR